MSKSTLSKIAPLTVALLLVAGYFYFASKHQPDPIDPLKAQGEMLERLSQLSPEELTKIPKKTGIDLAMLQDFKKTKDLKLGYVPVERKLEAYKMAKAILQRKSTLRTATLQEIAWEERGPNNVGGRTRALMFDPNDPEKKKVWAGGVSGGLWFTNDITSNTQWNTVDDFMANLAISCIVYDPSNTSTFYMGTGEGWFNGGAVRGAGIWKSTDGGSNWAQLASTNNSNFYYVQKLAALQDGSLLAATHAGIFKSTNGGTSWSNVLSGGRAADIEVASDGTIYASLGIFHSGTLHKSIDNGNNWTTLSPAAGGERIELAVAPSNPNVVYAVASSGSTNSVQWFRKSINAGATWTSITLPAQVDEPSSDFTRGQAWYDLIIGVFPNDHNKVIVGGIDLHMSNDGGSNWLSISHWYGGFGKPYVHADQHAIAFRPGVNTDVIFGNDGGVFYSNSFSVNNPSFSHHVNGYNVTQFYSCAIANDGSNTFLAGSQDNGSHLFSVDGINATEEVYGGDGGFCFINQNNPNVMVVSYIYNNFSVSTNGGNTFNDLPSQNDGEFINPADFDDKSNILYSAGADFRLVRVSNVTLGQNATRTELNISPFKNVSHINVSGRTENRLYVGTAAGEVFIINNAHASPTTTNISNGLNGGTISSIDVGASEDTLLTTVSNYGEISVYFSTNGGANWQVKEGNLPDIPVRWGLFNPNNNKQVLLATEVGIWLTNDITISEPIWEPASQGLANVRCDMLKYRKSDGLVAIATYGRGLYTTNAFDASVDPVAAFSQSKNVCYIGNEIQFTDESSLANNNWNWTFGDENTSNQQNPTHTYETAGVFEVKLSINNGASFITKTIQVLPDIQGSYVPSLGGDFESSHHHFGSISTSGTLFERGKSSVAEKGGTKSGNNAWVTGLNSGRYQDNSVSYLYTPTFFIDKEDFKLEFYTKFELESGYDGFIVEYSNDKGDSWNQLGSAVSDLWYNSTALEDNTAFTPGQAMFSSTSTSFVRKSFNLSDFVDQTLAFRFTFKTDASETKAGAAIDDFQVTSETDLFLNNPSKSISIKPLVYPNPSLGLISIKLENEHIGLVTIQIIDQTGRLVKQQTIIKSTEDCLLNLDMSNSAYGNYLLLVKMNEYQESVKFVRN